MTNNKTAIFKDLQKFIGNFCGIPIYKIKEYSKLESDLKIYGDDAIELILAYSKKYGVDIIKFPNKDFISPEGDTLLPLILGMFTKSKKKEG